MRGWSVTADPTPAEYGRSRALQAIAEHAEALSNQPHADRSDIPAPDRAYLRAYIETCASVAARLRSSPGYELTAETRVRAAGGSGDA